MIKVLFFAQLREQLGCGIINVSINSLRNVTDLRNDLVNRNPQWSEFLNNRKLMVAVNQKLVKLDHAIKPDDEVAFFPPVTGG